jgi:hypothetical protein
MKIKAVAVLLIIMLIVNMVLFAMRKISDILFWMIIIVGAIGAYAVKKSSKQIF